ncbi:MAG: glycoside hydrolase family 57 protein [Gammaproteobacteria bacterium]|nr:glycoside hydrolase family 57 protein [Gammaproteobacteria bacterium]
MSADSRVKVVLMWHMHQPQYQLMDSGIYQEPWVYLHAIKDYVDMVAHLEQVKAARAVINFVPVLLDQLADYIEQIREFRAKGAPLRDPLLASLAGELPATAAARLALMKLCLRANRKRLIEPWPMYAQLTQMVDWLDAHRDALAYINDDFLRDLLIWYHLAWLGETVRRNDERVKALLQKAHGFGEAEARQMIDVIGDLLDGLFGRYRALQDEGRVELSFSPYAHPLVPLLIDWTVAQEAQPEVELPPGDAYPDGQGRARVQLAAGHASFMRHFGRAPRGCWLPEGGISTAALHLLDDLDIEWTASGGAVLTHSLNGEELDGAVRLGPFRIHDTRVQCFFRDDDLSDRIAFRYAEWRAEDAVNDLVGAIETRIRAMNHAEGTVIPVILDGENAWEYYAHNGFYFLNTLYERLSTHPILSLGTFADVLDHGARPHPLPQLVAGSWVYGTFSTWIGSKDKNRAWEQLVRAKQAVDEALKERTLTPAQAAAIDQQLMICEGSDWFWWYGDYNPPQSVATFDALYRAHLRHLFSLIGVPPPDCLEQALGTGHGEPARGGTMRATHGEFQGGPA